MPRDARELRGGWTTFQHHWYGVPAADLAPFVAGYWAAEWDLRGQPPYRQKIVPYPQVHLSFRDGGALVRGPERGPVVRLLQGHGRVLGVSFRPGCFRPFLGASISTITGRALPAETVFGPGLPPLSGQEAGPAGARDRQAFEELSQAGAREVEAFLRSRLPPPDPLADLAAGIVARIQAEPTITRVDVLAAEVGLGLRRLQRLFAEHVGLGPKRVIRRYRLHEVGERLSAGVDIDWVRLAGELGYADQAHFVRDFTAMVGEPPTRYAERYPRGDPRH